MISKIVLAPDAGRNAMLEVSFLRIVAAVGIRHLQDDIHQSRMVIAQVPDLIYWRQRKQQEHNMRHTLNQFKAKAAAIVDSPPE